MLYLNDVDSKNVYKILAKLQSHKEFNDYGHLINCYVKSVLYNLDNLDNLNKENNKLNSERVNNNIKLINSMIVEYLNDCDFYDDNVQKNISLLIEASKAKEFSSVKEAMKKLGNSQDYLNYLKEDKIVEEGKLAEFIRALIFYAFKGSSFPIEWRNYLYKYYEDNRIISEIITTDIIYSFFEF